MNPFFYEQRGKEKIKNLLASVFVSLVIICGR